MPKTYIVTGGAGFIGSSLAQRLIDNGAKVFCLDNLSTGFKENIPRGAVFYKVDLSVAQSLANLKFPKKIDGIFHFAAQSSGEASFGDPLRDIDVNYKATYNVLKLCQKLKCKRFIFSSSMSVYGQVPSSTARVSEKVECQPVSYYGANKLVSEKIISIFCLNAGINYTIFRLFNVYGPGQNMRNMKQGMVSIYLSYLMNNEPVLVKGSLSRFRDFIFIGDVTDVCLRSLNNRKTYGEVFNVATSKKTTVKELLNVTLKVYKKKNFNQWVIVRGNTSGDVSGLTADISKLKKALDWQPSIELAQGISRMKSWVDVTAAFWKG